MKSYRLAVIIPSFNYERYIGRAIESVISQGRDDVEVLVVDDSSSDGSWNVIQRYGLAKTYRVPNCGQLKACLTAAKNTNAEFILVLDSDDELKPGSLDRILPLLTPSVAKLQFTLTLIDADGKVVGSPAPQLQEFKERQLLINEIQATGSYTNPPTSGNVFRRDVFDLLDDVDYDWSVDGVSLFAAPFFGDIISLSDQLGCYRLHGSSVSGVGMAPDVAKIRFEISRFAARLNHLHHILSDRGLPHSLPRAEDTYFYRERSVFMAIAEGRRPSASQVFGALSALRRQPMSLKLKAALAAFAIISIALPTSRAAPLLAYRRSPIKRSAFGVIRRLVTG